VTRDDDDHDDDDDDDDEARDFFLEAQARWRGVKEAGVLGSRFEVEKRLRLRLKKRSGKTIHFLLDSFHHRFPSRSLRKRTKPRLRIMAAPQRVLYWGSGSAPAWRVMITLAEKKLVRGRTKRFSMA
jgi:hypothetical protein